MELITTQLMTLFNDLVPLLRVVLFLVVVIGLFKVLDWLTDKI